MAKQKVSEQSGKQRTEVVRKVKDRAVADYKKGPGAFGRYTTLSKEEHSIVSGRPQSKGVAVRSQNVAIQLDQLDKKLNFSNKPKK